MADFRIATFNVENLDETAPGEQPSLAERLALMKPQIVRLCADVVCFQEVHGQEREGNPGLCSRSASSWLARYWRVRPSCRRSHRTTLCTTSAI